MNPLGMKRTSRGGINNVDRRFRVRADCDGIAYEILEERSEIPRFYVLNAP